MLRMLAMGIALIAVLAGGAGGAEARPAVPAGGISGALLDQDRHPIPGALVTLYERGTGYLVDSTYTRPDGRFDLRPPGRKTDLDLVALKGEKSARAGLTRYDPAAPGTYREVVLWQRRSRAAEIWDFFVSRFEWIVGSIAAFLLGYLLKQWEGIQGARRTLDRRAAELVRLVKAARRQLANPPGMITDARYRSVLAALGPQIAALEAELPKSEDAVFSLRGLEGGRQYGDYRERIQQIQKLGDPGEELASALAVERLHELDRLLAELETHALTGARPPWWRRWRLWRRTASTS
ncbi:MAG TPA: carboxypeptidase-like regulatory domain-containing protein [Thermoanaerobaculia bacterium]|nr:carboxypeptidase-like regulatory domain-containing protein [Thermoanaerobaculia bacterium]